MPRKNNFPGLIPSFRVPDTRPRRGSFRTGTHLGTLPGILSPLGATDRAPRVSTHNPNCGTAAAGMDPSVEELKAVSSNMLRLTVYQYNDV
jgi:hypothetical protein